MSISYAGGDGNDVVLTAVAPLVYDAASNASVTSYTLRLNGANLQLVDAHNPATVLATEPLAYATQVNITGNVAGSDTLTIDYSGGYFSIPGGITFNGGGFGNLLVNNGSFASLTNTPTGPGEGNIVVHPSAGLDSTITYLGLIPPVNLGYAANAPVVTKGTPITADAPSNSGGSAGPYAISPALPAGLNFDPSTGIISGTPTALSAATSYTVTATNFAGSTTASLTITVNDVAPSNLSYTTNPAVYTKGTAITADAPTSSGGAVVSFGISPALPTGLNFNANTGAITGMPTVLSAATSYTVTASNSGGSTTATLTITVNDVPPSNLTYASNPAAYTLGLPITANMPTSAGGAVVTYAISPALLTGLTFNTGTGAITGTPTLAALATSYSVTAFNSGGSTSTNLTISVPSGPTGTINIDLPNFSWVPVTGALHYHFWLGDNTTGQMPLLNVPIVTGTTFSLASALTPGHSYTWYAGAVTSSGTAWGNGLTFAVSPLAAPTTKTPHTPVTSDEPPFAWTPANSGTPPASYELWIMDKNTLNVVTIPNLPAAPTSYALTAAQALTPGHSFTWYIGAVSANGQAVAWSSPGVSFSIAAVGAPTANTPNTQVSTDQPTFTWTAGAGSGTLPTFYELWIADQTTHNVVTIPNLSAALTSYTLTAAQALTPGDTFIWYVAAVSANGQAVAWSSPGVNFSISGLAGGVAANSLSSQLTDRPTFSWAPPTASGTPPASYELWIADQTTHNVVTIPNLPAASASYTLTAAQALTPGHSFMWYVGAVSANGQAITWTSAGVTFSIADLAAGIAATTPNDQRNTDRPTFSWTAPTATGTPASSYELWIADQTTHSVVTIPNLPIAATAYQLTAAQALTPGHSFTWYVGAVSANGQAIAWSSPGVNFSLLGLAGGVTATTPNSQTSTDRPTFSWTAPNGAGTPASSYELWIADQTTHTVATIANLPSAATTYQLTDAQALTPGDNFTWYVGAVSANGQAIAWSAAGVNFSIASLAAPTANSPNATVATTTPTFTWTAAASGTPAATYELWLFDQNTNIVTTIPAYPQTHRPTPCRPLKPSFTGISTPGMSPPSAPMDNILSGATPVSSSRFSN